MRVFVLQGFCDFADKTVVLAAAGCAPGRALALAYADRGARVIVLDREEARAHAIAAENPARIDSLRLDTLHPAACALFARIWEAEPIDVLIHLQPLRQPDRPGAATQAVPALTRALRAGIEAGDGRVLFLYRAADAAVPAEMRCFALALGHLAKAMQAELGSARLAVNGLKLDPGLTEDDTGPILRPAFFLTGGKGRNTAGTVLPVSAPSD